MKAYIEASGATVIYLSPYSPDFNPLENCWSKLKEYLRSVGARNREPLQTALTFMFRDYFSIKILEIGLLIAALVVLSWHKSLAVQKFSVFSNLTINPLGSLYS